MNYETVSQLKSFYSPVYIENSKYFFCYSEKQPLPSEPITSLHYHKCLEIGICTGGSGNCIIENRLYRYSKGDIQIVLPFQPHLANSNCGSNATWIWLSYDPYKLITTSDFKGDICNILEKQVNFSGVFKPEEYPELTTIINKCLAETQTHKRISQLYALLLVQQLILELSRINFPLKNNITQRRLSFDKILPALEHVSKNLNVSEELKIDVLAQKCYTSTATLRRYFYKFTDMSPQQFIAQIRISNAKYLLTNTSMSITDISQKVGFESISCFTRAFKRICGTSPSEYKKL